MKPFLIAGLLLCLAGSAYAAPQTEEETKNTKLLSVVIDFKVSDYKSAKPMIDAKTKELEKLIADFGIPSVDFWATQYNVTTPLKRADCGDLKICYAVTGSIGFTLMPAGREDAIVTMLAAKGYKSSVNQYYFGNCGGGG